MMYPFPNCNGCVVDVWEWISNFSQFMMDVITYPCRSMFTNISCGRQLTCNAKMDDWFQRKKQYQNSVFFVAKKLHHTRCNDVIIYSVGINFIHFSKMHP